MNRYYVKQIDEDKYGVFDSIPRDDEHVHCKDPEANLIVWCCVELNAEKIAEVLNVDDHIYDRYLFTKDM